MKKILLILLSALLMLSLVACGEKEASDISSDVSSAETSSVAESDSANAAATESGFTTPEIALGNDGTDSTDGENSGAGNSTASTSSDSASEDILPSGEELPYIEIE